MGEIKVIPTDYVPIQQMKFIPASDSASAGAFGASGAPFKNGNHKFIPAEALPEGGSFKNNSKFEPAYLTGREERSLNWWSPDAFFQYDSMLVSAFYGMKTPNYRDFYGIPRKGFTLFGDSGGFQNSSQSAGLNEANVLRWQEANCDIGFVLDYPIHPTTPDNLIEIFRKRTVDNAEFALSHQQNKDMKLYAVLHGRNDKELTTMVNQYGDLSRFDGVALGSLVPKKSDYMYIAYVSMLFAEKVQDLKLPVHFFGVTGINSIPIVLYVAKKYNLQITFDSASYGCGAQHREYWNPFNLIRNRITFGTTPEKSDQPEEVIIPPYLPCDCPVCESAGTDLINWVKNNKNNSVVGSLISLHNLYVFIRFSKMVSCYAERDRLLKGLVKNICVDTTTTALEFIDFSLENGIDAGCKKYYPDEKEKPAPETKSSLFDFE